jgi:hypothetical protein
MAKSVFTNGYVSINSSDLSASASQVTFDRALDAQESTTMNSTGDREYLAGLKGATGSITFRQDFADNALDEQLNALYEARAATAFAIRPVNTTIGTGNPEYQFNAIITGYSPISGSVGNTLDTTLTFTVTGAVTRATSA